MIKYYCIVPYKKKVNAADAYISNIPLLWIFSFCLEKLIYLRLQPDHLPSSHVIHLMPPKNIFFFDQVDNKEYNIVCTIL